MREGKSLSEEGDADSPHEKNEVPLFEAAVFQSTIAADITSNKTFLLTHFRITAVLTLIVVLLKFLPSPLILNIVENDPALLARDICSEEECSDVDEGYEVITVKKINPLHRELKYFVRLNQKQMGGMVAAGVGGVDLNQEITWIEIYAARNNSAYGPPIYEKSGEDAYEVIFNGQPLIFIGEVHVLSEPTYLLKIYKKIHPYRPPRLLPTNSTDPDNATNDDNTSPDDVVLEVSAPLRVEVVRYSEFFTGTELLIRYITFLVILYVRAETTGCPAVFQLVLLFTANPLIFTEIAFPNTASNLISNMCSSAYIFYIAVFLHYTHRRLANRQLDLALRAAKLLATIALYAASILRQLHLVNQTLIELGQYVLILVVLVPMLQYLWKVYFFKSKTILHRDVLFILLALYYFLLLFFSGYIVEYGWKKISFYLIILAYGLNLCYLTTPQQHPHPDPHKLPEHLPPHQEEELTHHSQLKTTDIRIEHSESSQSHSMELVEQQLTNHQLDKQPQPANPPKQSISNP